MTPRVLGAACKRCAGKTTRELINFHRVKYAKEKITSGYLDQYTLDALGKEAGFSSRTTFFNAFKKELGQSPTAFWTDFQKGDT